jgi:multiple sugar transport system permease protein
MSRPAGWTVRERRISFYLFLSPWLLGFLLFWVFPLLWGFRVSLTNRTLFTANPAFVGLRNYLALVRDPVIRYSFLTTLLYTLCSTGLSIGLGLVLALLLERSLPGRSWFRTLFYFPCLIPDIAVGWVFRIFLERDSGLLNILLRLRVDWLTLLPRGALVSLSAWQAGWGMLILLGGLSTIPGELSDAASIDGASYRQRLRHITLPLLTPFLLFLAVTGFIASMQVFLLPFILSPFPQFGPYLFERGLPRETNFVMSRALFLTISNTRFAYGLALMWLLFLSLLAFTFLFLRLSRFWVFSEAEQAVLRGASPLLRRTIPSGRRPEGQK